MRWEGGSQQFKIFCAWAKQWRGPKSKSLKPMAPLVMTKAKWTSLSVSTAHSTLMYAGANKHRRRMSQLPPPILVYQWALESLASVGWSLGSALTLERNSTAVTCHPDATQLCCTEISSFKIEYGWKASTMKIGYMASLFFTFCPRRRIHIITTLLRRTYKMTTWCCWTLCVCSW